MISIVIPLHGEGAKFLAELIESVGSQTFTDYEVVISNDGVSWPITENLPFQISFARKLSTRCVRGVPGAAANLNNGIAHARGDIIKPMFQDDKFLEPDSLQKIADTLSGSKVKWAACQSQNGGDEGLRSDLFKPYPHKSIERLREGENTYGSPSVMAWRRNDFRFDENLHWLFDCEFYGRMAERYGVPAFVDTRIFIRQWSGMATVAVANGNQRITDHNYVVEKYRDHGGQPFV